MTHQHSCVCVVPDVGHLVPRGTVHPRARSVQHGDGQGGRQHVDPVHHGPLGPAQRLGHGPETHLATGGKSRVRGEQIICRKGFKFAHYEAERITSSNCVRTDYLCRGLLFSYHFIFIISSSSPNENEENISQSNQTPASFFQSQFTAQRCKTLRMICVCCLLLQSWGELSDGDTF